METYVNSPAAQLEALNGWNGAYSLLFVTLGNAIGGMVLLGVPLFLAYRRKPSKVK